MRASRPSGRWVLGGIVATIALAAASTVAFGVAGGAFRSDRSAPNGQCSAPALPGAVVDAVVTNMGGGTMMDSSMGGMMRVRTDRHEVPAGTVSLRVANDGSLVHELIVLPLGPGEGVGQRAVGSDSRVDETDSVGEASTTCGEGEGDGIDPGALSWVTLHLEPGHYELVCNLPGHYAAGMYTELDVR